MSRRGGSRVAAEVPGATLPRGSQLVPPSVHSRALGELPADDPRVGIPLYALAEVAQYLRIPYSTLQSWVHPSGGRSPLVSSLPRTGHEASVPFIGLAEAFVLQAARRAGVPRSRIRPGVEAVRSELGLEHALATRVLYTDGAELLVKYAADEADLEVARTRQRQLTETVRDQLQLLTYGSDGYASRLQLPDFESVGVIVDPGVAFGYPVVEKTGTRIADVVDRFWAGESLHDIAYDFGLTEEAVEALVRAQTRPTR